MLESNTMTANETGHTDHAAYDTSHSHEGRAALAEPRGCSLMAV